MPAVVEKRATAKWVMEFQYLRSIATGALAQFLDFITYVPSSVLSCGGATIVTERARVCCVSRPCWCLCVCAYSCARGDGCVRGVLRCLPSATST